MALRRLIFRPLSLAVLAITAAMVMFGVQRVWSQSSSRATPVPGVSARAPTTSSVQLPSFSNIRPDAASKPLEKAPPPFERFPAVRTRETTAVRAIQSLFGRPDAQPAQLAERDGESFAARRAVYAGQRNGAVRRVNQADPGSQTAGQTAGQTIGNRPLSPVMVAATEPARWRGDPPRPNPSRVAMAAPLDMSAPVQPAPVRPAPVQPHRIESIPLASQAPPKVAEIKPRVAQEAIEVPKVTLHLANVEVRQAFEMFSRAHAINVLIAPDVEGAVTANFVDVPLEQAIQAVLTLCNLSAHRENNMLFVYSSDKYPKMEMKVRTFALNYISSDDLLTGVTALLSGSGTVFTSKIDPKNNRMAREVLVVSDTPAGLLRIEQLVSEMDRPPRQVLIEAHVLEVDLSMTDRHGVNYKQLLGNEFTLDMTGFANPMATPALFASIKGSQVDAMVEWLRSTTDAKTLASPRVMVINGQTARIQVGEQLGFKVVTVTETSAVEEVKFLEVGVVLEVTPQVTSDNRVMMRVKPEVSSGVINPDTLLPEEETRELETDVLLTDGQGVVIGGLIQEKDSNVQHKLPFFGDIWLVGKFFQRRELVKRRSEIIVTLVPRIITQGLPVTERDIMCGERSQAPLFQGPLQRMPRVEPMLPDTIFNPVRTLR